MQAKEKGTKLIDEDGLFSLVAAAPESNAKPAVQTKAEASPTQPIPANNFYAGKAAAGSDNAARKAALAAGSLAASGVHVSNITAYTRHSLPVHSPLLPTPSRHSCSRLPLPACAKPISETIHAVTAAVMAVIQTAAPAGPLAACHAYRVAASNNSDLPC